MKPINQIIFCLNHLYRSIVFTKLVSIFMSDLNCIEHILLSSLTCLGQDSLCCSVTIFLFQAAQWILQIYTRVTCYILFYLVVELWSFCYNLGYVVHIQALLILVFQWIQVKNYLLKAATAKLKSKCVAKKKT